MNNPRSLTVALWVISGSYGAMLLVLLEAASLLIHGTISQISPLVVLIGALLGLYLPFGILISLLLALLWQAASRALGMPLGSKIVQGLRRLREEPESDIKAASWLIAFSLSAVVVAVAPGVAFLIARSFENQLLASVFLSLSSLAGIAVAVVLAPTFHLFARFFFKKIQGPGKRLPKRFGLALTIILGGSTAAFAYFALTRLSGVDLFPLYFSLGLLLMLPLFLWVGKHTSSRSARYAALTLTAAAASLCAASATGLSNKQQLAQNLSQDTLFAPKLLHLARALSDFDRDGASALFSGGDCDDNDSSIYPGAKEIPGNGKDDNCLGGDAPALASESPKTAPESQASLATSLPTATPQLNFLIITIDTLRADHLGSYGYSRPTSPRMDALAAQSVRFANTYAQAPHTPRSFPSFLTSKLPSEIVWVKQFANYPELKEENLTFFEVLAQNGYQTAAVASHHYFAPERKITQGIQDFQNPNPGTIASSNDAIKAPEIVPLAEKQLASLNNGKRFALWVHLFEPHARYMSHNEVPEFGAKLPDKYDEEIAFTDIYVGKLLDTLDRLGLANNTAVILFSDHGEAFGEHKVYFHGQTLYEEVLRIPFLLRVPGIAPRVVTERVSLLDLFPTLCDLARAEMPKNLSGRSLLPEMLGQRSDKNRTIVSQLLPYPNLNEEQLAIIKGKYKLIYRITDNLFELYNLEEDPSESNNLYEIDKNATSIMLQEVERMGR